METPQQLTGQPSNLPDDIYWSFNRAPDSKLDVYAGACLAEALKYPTGAGVYDLIVQSWGLPGCRGLIDLYAKHKPETRAWLRDKARAIVRKVPLPDFPAQMINDFSQHVENNWDFQNFLTYIEHFVLVAFNSKEDLENKAPKVLLQNSIHLFNAIRDYSLLDYLEEHPELKGPQVITGVELSQFHLFVHTLANRVPSWPNREIRRHLRKLGFELQHFSKITSDAEKWYGCRVIYAGPEEFCRVQYRNTGIFLDPRNVGADIKIFDYATGYPRRK